MEILDVERTDMSVRLRSAAWYRARLDADFFQVGAGLWASRRSGLRLYALEGPEAPHPRSTRVR